MGWAVWMLFAGCFGARTTEARDRTVASSMAASAEAGEDGVKADGLVVDLYDADPAAGGTEVIPRPAARALDARTVNGILARSPDITADGADEQPFALRSGPKPPPLPGSDVSETFPPQAGAARPAVPTGALRVTRHQPEGAVPIAPHLSISFDQPMVAIGAVSDPRQVPVRLSPTPPGRWRWLGTQTLVFQPDGERMPMATEYTVEVPAGTKSAAGNALAEALRFSFVTPPPVLQSSCPSGGPIGLEPVIVLAFDQRIDASAVLKHVSLRGGPEVGLRLATASEVAEDEVARAVVANLQADRVVALRATSKLVPATGYTVAIGEGTPSAEGSRATTSEQTGSFYTYPPLTVTGAHCWYQDPCPPTAPLIIELSNPLADGNDLSAVTVEPVIPGLSVAQYGNQIHVTGALTGRTTYTVTVPAAIADVFGQTLGAASPQVFHVGPAEKTLYGPGDTMVVLDPAAGGKLPVFTVNHDALTVTVSRVTPDDWAAWLKWMDGVWDGTGKKALPGTAVAKTTVRPAAKPDQLVETGIDLSPYLVDGVGQFLVQIEPTKQPKERWRRQILFKWVQVTNIGLHAMVDGRKLVGWATALADGAPLPDTALSLLDGGKGATGADGLASLELPTSSREVPNVLVARRGKDLALLPESLYRWGGNAWVRTIDLTNLRWYVIDDRGLYKPGETAKIKGWLRRSEPGPTGDLAGLRQLGKIHYRLYDSVGNEILTGEVPVTGLGGFSLALDLPKDMNTGGANLQLEAVDVGSVSGTSMSHELKVAEFRRPEFEVHAASDADAHLIGDRGVIDLDAAYYAGGGLANADVTWTVYARPTSYQPPGWADYSFGTWTPWWRAWNEPAEKLIGEHRATTDGAGVHHLGIFFRSVHPSKPMLVRAEGTVQDVNRQAWTASDTVLLHPSSRYVGLRAAAAFVEKGKPVDVQVVLVDLDGKPVAGGAEVVFARQEGRWTRSGWSEETVEPQTCTVRTGADGKGSCSFPTVRGGQFTVTASTEDEQARANQSELRVWVSGAEIAPARQIELEEVTLVPEKKDVAIGETARILVQSPFTPAEAVLTVRRDGLLSTERFMMDGPTRTVSIPITDAMVPDITVQVDLVGEAARLDDQGQPLPGAPARPAHATGSLTIPIAPVRRTLQVALKPAESVVAPGAETSITVEVRDASGEPLKDAEVALIVADESVLALTGYQLPDPLEVFYAARGAGVGDTRSRALIALANPQLAAQAQPGGGGRKDEQMMLEMDGAVGGAAEPRRMRAMAPPPSVAAKASPEAPVFEEGEVVRIVSDSIVVRTDFSALALFAPDARTDARGRAVVPLKLPDSLTRYRIMAVAVDPDRSFGSAESAITARLPLMVRPSAPRFLNTGDQFELPIVVQNQTDRAMTVDVAVRATNLKWIDKVSSALPPLASVASSSAGKRVVVPANDRVEVRFPAAAQMAGTARIQAVAVAGKATDAAELSLPVWTPATTEAFASYGTVAGPGVVQPVQAPGDAWPTFGALTVTTSSTQLQALTDAVIYLQTYPYECSEQIASRLLGIASLRDVLSAFEADGLPPKEQLEAQVRKDIDRLAVLQHWDGGFSFWRKDDESWPYLSIHVANALARAKAKGFDVPTDTWNRSLDHLQTIERHIPEFYSPEAKWFLRAYALDVRRRMGDPDPKEAKALFAEAKDGLGIDGIAFLLPTLDEAKATVEVEAILRRLGNNTNETAGAAHFVTAYTDGEQLLLHSDRRADGIVLEALLETRPDEDLIPKVVRGLLAHQTKGRWANTQENAFVLLALDRYFHVYEKETPDFVARIWLGDGYAGEHAFRGRTTERSHVAIPMATLTERSGPQPLTLARDGTAGRLYYRVGLTYAPKDLKLAPLDEGFVVTRAYEAVDDPRDVRRDGDGTWHVRAGARVKVSLSMVAEARRYHVALVDPMPAGLEALNPELATTGTLPQQVDASSDPWWWWSRTWYEHENFRDERVEVFASLLWEGVHEYSYFARATTPGRFVVPPPKAEEMYMPETFGRGGTDVVVVDP